MASILVVAGPNQGDYYPLGQRTLVIGRDEKCSIQIVDELVSGKHLQIHFRDSDGKHHALDMKSTNGVFINGVAIHDDRPLEDGDSILLGNSELVYYQREFEDKTSALHHYKKPGQRDRSTIVGR